MSLPDPADTVTTTASLAVAPSLSVTVSVILCVPTVSVTLGETPVAI